MAHPAPAKGAAPESSTEAHSVSQGIAVIDFGSQYTHLIARRIRDLNVYSEIIRSSASWESVQHLSLRGVILSGGPASVYAAGAPKVPSWVFEQRIPVLGICYGLQALVHQLGGKVVPGQKQEYGSAVLHENATGSPLFKGLPSSFQVWMSHGDRVMEMPPGFNVVAKSEGAPFAAIADDERRFFGLQFHPEVIHTPDGANLLRAFALKVANCSGDWSMNTFRAEAIENIRTQVGNGRVICGLSGGVDSSVAAVLIHQAIGDQLTCVLVDHGLMRTGEANDVVELFRERFNIPLIHRDASQLFLSELNGVSDPEEKRKVIGNTFITVFEEEANKLGGTDFLHIQYVFAGADYLKRIEHLLPLLKLLCRLKHLTYVAC